MVGLAVRSRQKLHDLRLFVRESRVLVHKHHSSRASALLDLLCVNDRIFDYEGLDLGGQPTCPPSEEALDLLRR